MPKFKGKTNRAKKGEVRNPNGKPAGQTLISRIKGMLEERSLNPNSTYNYRFDDVANAYVKQMEKGSFPHLKEFIERESGKVPTRISDAEGKNLKLYVGMPVDDDDPDAP